MRDDADGFAGEGRHDLLSLAPAESVLLFGATTSQGQKIAPWQVDQLKQQLAAIASPASLAQLLEDADRILLAGEYSKESPAFSRPVNENTLRQGKDQERAGWGYAAHGARRDCVPH